MATAYAAHESEWIYSSFLSRALLTPINNYVHELPSLPHPIELLVATCGYAFNPVMFPLWPMLIYALTRRGFEFPASTPSRHEENVRLWGHFVRSHEPERGAILHSGLYVLSVLATLIFTEIAKASFASTRPQVPPEGYDGRNWSRRYGKLVGSLKSKHAFPSGDSAQAMNLCMFFWRFMPDYAVTTIMGNEVSLNAILFGVFLPGVVFARIFYRCHWIEDCIGGISLSWILHYAVSAITREIQQKYGKVDLPD